MKNSKKGFVVPLIIAIVAVLIVGGEYYYSWKWKEGIAINHPVTPIVVQNNSDQTKDWKTYKNTDGSLSIKYPSSWFYNEFKQVKYTSAGSVQNFEGIAFCPTGTFSKQNCADVPMMNISAPIFINIATKPITPSSFVLVDEKYMDIYNKMLLTFKFTTPASQTADWKTYTNTQYGFEFKYPADKYRSPEITKVNPGSITITLEKIGTGQSHFIEIELWDSKESFNAAHDYVSRENPTIKEIGGKIITFWDKTEVNIIEPIISTFKFTASVIPNDISTNENFKAIPVFGSAPLKVTFHISGKDNAFATVNFGDGKMFSTETPSNLDYFGCDAAGLDSVCQGTHIYLSSGIYTAKLYDRQGKQLDTVTVTVTN